MSAAARKVEVILHQWDSNQAWRSELPLCLADPVAATVLKKQQHSQRPKKAH